MDDELIDIYDANRRPTGEVVNRRRLSLGEGQFMLYVLALLENRDGRVLITQRATDKRWAAGWWEVPGGGVLAGETSRSAVTREVAEEASLDVTGIDARPVYGYTNVDPTHADNYLVDIYHFRLDFSEADIGLHASEAVDFRIATWDQIRALHERGTFLHYDRLQQALEAEGLL